MSFPINPPNVPIVDQHLRPTGEFYRFLLQMWRVVGEPVNPNDESAFLGMAASFADAQAPQPVYLLSVLEPGALTAGGGLTGSGNMANNLTIAVGAGTGITVNADSVALDTTHVRNVDHSAVTITAGAGLTGGGTIEATRTVNVGAGTGITVNADDVALTIPTAAGTYTPTLTNVLNLDASTAFVCQYLQVGSIVTVSGKVNMDPTAAGAVTLGISLPIASNFANQEQCAGTGACTVVAGVSFGINADTTNDRAQIQYIATDTSNRNHFFVFQYLVI